MNNDSHDFEQFMKQRDEASRASVNGEAGPLGRIVTRVFPATFFGPMEGYEQGIEQVASTHERGAAQFESGDTSFEMLQMAASDGIGYCVGLQRATVRMAGKPEAVPFNLRVTEVFRREGDGWKLVHRPPTLCHPNLTTKRSNCFFRHSRQAYISIDGVVQNAHLQA